MPWKATGKSVTGILHQKYNLPCQDYHSFNLLNENEIIVGAVADGAGSARYAEYGAKVAVETVIARMPQKLEGFLSEVNSHSDLPESEKEKVRQLCLTLIQEVKQELEEKAQQLECSLADLACTLIAFTALPEAIVAFQIGDGFLVTHAEGETDYNLLFQPDKGEFANETIFVTSKLAEQTIEVKVLNQKTIFICAATDGLERVAIRFQGWQPFTPFFQPLENFMVNSHNQSDLENPDDIDSESPTRPEQSQKPKETTEQDGADLEEQRSSEKLQDICHKNNQKVAEIQRLEDPHKEEEDLSYLGRFLNSERLNARTNDDKTILLCLYEPTNLSASH